MTQNNFTTTVMTIHRFMSGLKPTGSIHVGHYCSVLRPFLESSKQHPSNLHFFMVADYHALTQAKTKQEHIQNITHCVALLCVLKQGYPNIYIYRQSDITSLGNINWILTTFLPRALLERCHAYKSHVDDKSMGLLSYPILMAADIYASGADRIFVGQDQQQHMELLKDIRRKIYDRYQLNIACPLSICNSDPIPGLDGRKMSKSYHNTIPLLASHSKLQSMIRKIKTTSCDRYAPKSWNDCLLFKLYQSLLDQEEVRAVQERYTSGQDWYSLKQDLTDTIYHQFRWLHDPYHYYVNNWSLCHQELDAGAEKINTYADSFLSLLQNAIGLRF